MTELGLFFAAGQQGTVTVLVYQDSKKEGFRLLTELEAHSKKQRLGDEEFISRLFGYATVQETGEVKVNLKNFRDIGPEVQVRVKAPKPSTSPLVPAVPTTAPVAAPIPVAGMVPPVQAASSPAVAATTNSAQPAGQQPVAAAQTYTVTVNQHFNSQVFNTLLADIGLVIPQEEASKTEKQGVEQERAGETKPLALPSISAPSAGSQEFDRIAALAVLLQSANNLAQMQHAQLNAWAENQAEQERLSKMSADEKDLAQRDRQQRELHEDLLQVRVIQEAMLAALLSAQVIAEQAGIPPAPVSSVVGSN